MNLSCVNRFPPFFFFFFSSSPSVDVSLVLQDHLSRILSSLLLHQIPPMLLGELSVSRICQSEPYSRGIASFLSFRSFWSFLLFSFVAYSRDSRILVNLGYLGGYIIGRVESLRETFSPRAEVSRLSIEGSRRGEYMSYIYTRQFLVNSFWQGNVEWCTELQWSSFEMIRKDKYITQEIKLS